MKRRIMCNPEICGGRPCIEGTRIPIVVILDELAEGASFEEITKSYPTLEAQDVLTVIGYASRLASAVVRAGSFYG